MKAVICPFSWNCLLCSNKIDFFLYSVVSVFGETQSSQNTQGESITELYRNDTARYSSNAKNVQGV